MSFMTILKNKSCTIIAAESMLSTEYEDGRVYTRNDFDKVFFSKDKGMIWGVVGYYGRENDLLNEMNRIIYKEDYNHVLKELGYSISSHIPEGRIVNIFIAKADEALKAEFQKTGFDYMLYRDSLSCQAGTHWYTESLFELSEIEQAEEMTLVNMATQMTLEEIHIDNNMHMKTPNHRISMGGDVKCLLINQEEKIKKFINGEEVSIY